MEIGGRIEIGADGPQSSRATKESERLFSPLLNRHATACIDIR